MKEKIIVDNKKALVLTFGILLVIITIFGLSYAYFSVNVDPNQSSTMELTSAYLGVEFNDSSEIHIDSLVPGQSVSKTFTVNNTGEGNLYYDLIFTNVESTVVGSDFVYTLTSTNGGGTVSETVMPTNFSTLVTGILIPTDTNQIYTLTITYKNNPMEDQSVNMNAYFNGRIELQSPYNSGTNTLIDIHEDFAYIEPTELVPNPYYTYPISIQGKYKLEVWGASGGSYSSSCKGGLGGYAQGEILLSRDTNLYVYVGGQGLGDGTHVFRPGGYNGGGDGVLNSDTNTRQSSGGGATHIAIGSTARGVLSNYSSHISEVLIVGGGGGGGGGNVRVMCTAGGGGGGLSGLNGVTYTEGSWQAYGIGASQISGGCYYSSSSGGSLDLTRCGTFGQGASQTVTGGGGGFYGGGAFSYSGGGGSSYINNLANANTIASQRSGNGYAKITYIGN